MLTLEVRVLADTEKREVHGGAFLQEVPVRQVRSGAWYNLGPGYVTVFFRVDVAEVVDDLPGVDDSGIRYARRCSP